VCGVERPRAWLTAGREAVKLLHGRSTVSGVKHERVFQAKLRFYMFPVAWLSNRHTSYMLFSLQLFSIKSKGNRVIVKKWRKLLLLWGERYTLGQHSAE